MALGLLLARRGIVSGRTASPEEAA